MSPKKRRRSFTPAQKRAHVIAYEKALVEETGQGYLRQHGIYASQIAEWRRLRDAGVLDKTPGESTKTPRVTAEQQEIARLRKQLAKAEKKLHTTETALQIMGKAHALCAPRGAWSYPRRSREELGRKFLGLMAYPAPKG